MTTSRLISPPHLHDSVRWKNCRIGLLGGSFNPPHDGHLHIARLAQIQFGLDFVWWIVTPQNPLKERARIAPYEKRFQQVEAITKYNPRFIPTHLERDLKTQYTYQTVTALKQYFPRTDFLWICGMDNALIFHHWDQWQSLADSIPIVFIARPPANNLVINPPLRQYKSRTHHYSQTKMKHTNLKKPGIYWLKGTKMVDISSTEIRNKSVG